MQACTICRHRNVKEINQFLARGEAVRTIAKQLRLSPSALQRLKSKCVVSLIAEAKEVSTAETAAALIEDLKKLTSWTVRLAQRAAKDQDLKTALQAIARLENQLTLKARLLGALDNGRKGSGDRGAPGVTIEYVDKLGIAAPQPGQATEQEARAVASAKDLITPRRCARVDRKEAHLYYYLLWFRLQ